mgnify:CR=1 FL=1|jgi:hypothetical protein
MHPDTLFRVAQVEHRQRVTEIARVASLLRRARRS